MIFYLNTHSSSNVLCSIFIDCFIAYYLAFKCYLKDKLCNPAPVVDSHMTWSHQPDWVDIFHMWLHEDNHRSSENEYGLHLLNVTSCNDSKVHVECIVSWCYVFENFLSLDYSILFRTSFQAISSFVRNTTS